MAKEGNEKKGAKIFKKIAHSATLLERRQMGFGFLFPS
jgi:hypothetical protein